MSTLEATMICADNSEWMRNGDYDPSRWEVLKETISAVVNHKLDSNQEARVGLLSMASRGKRCQVHLSPQRNSGEIHKILNKQVCLQGTSNVLTAIETAKLVLKNRSNKNLRQRVIVLIGSPVEQDVKDFIDLGKKLHKLNVAVDVINFGLESESSNEKLEALVNATNGEGGDARDTSHFVYIKPGVADFVDAVMTSRVFGAASRSRGGASGGFGSLGSSAADEDEQMQLAMRMSLEAEYQRMQEGSKPSGGANATPMQVGNDGDNDDEDEEDDEEDDEELAAALALSLASNAQVTTEAKEASQADNQSEKQSTQEKKNETEEEDVDEILQDPDFLDQLLSEGGLSTQGLTVDDLVEGDDDDDDDVDADTPSKKKQRK